MLYQGAERRITGVTTQGRTRDDQWVASYTVAYGNDPSQFQMYRERTGQDKVIWHTCTLDDAPNFGYVTERQQDSYGS